MKPEQKRYILENINKKSLKEISLELGVNKRKIRKFLEKEKGTKEQITPHKKVPPSLKKKTIFLSIILIIILGFIAYADYLNGHFIWDDDYLIKNNVYIRDWSNIKNIFTQDIGAGSGRRFGFYRPLQMITYTINYSLGGLDVRGFHLTNIILHILVALSIYWLINLLYKDNLLSLLTSLLFVIHPVHTEAVAYISGRADSLVTLFMLLSLIFYIKNLYKESTITYLFMLVSYILALLSRENSLILPVILLLYHYTYKKKVKTKEFLPIVGFALIYIVLRMTILKSLLPQGSLYPTTFFQRIPGFFVAITNYTRLLIAPFNLHMEYGNNLFNFSDPKAIIGIFIMATLIVYAVKKRALNNLVFFSIAFFFITILPQSNLYSINAYMAEHWLYLPSIGFFLILAKALGSIYRIRPLKIISASIIIILTVFYLSLTIKQNDYWKDPILFYEKTIKYAPGSARMYNDLGRLYEQKGRIEEAIDLYKKAIEIDPLFSFSYNNLGVIYRNMGKTEEAITFYKKALEINPEYPDALNNLALAYHYIGRIDESISLYKKAINLHPNFAGAYNNLGSVYTTADRNEEAIAMYMKAIEIEPGFSDAYYNLGLLYFKLGRNKEAIASYRKAVEINPNHALAHNNLAVAYYHDMEYDLAIKHCDRAIELGYRVDPQFLKSLESFRK